MHPLKFSSDILLDIATGRSRKELHWKNTQTLWSTLVKKLSETHPTAETFAEYAAAKKPRQDEIKDIGGFVGGLLTGGRRKPEAVMHRQLITLDMDQAPKGFWEDFTMLYDFTACVYSTHKHSASHPRLRLIIPLDRTVNVAEYEAIGRWIAGQLGIEGFDHTGFQPYRLMYWPSTSKDAEYLFEYQDGPLLIANEILANYTDYTDSSQWPVSKNVHSRITREITKQGDPLTKRGLIGAFCRCYSIEEAIEKYLSDVYDPVDSAEDRYTYKTGSTAAGLVVYDDKYAFSHHGTDPVSGKLCNAFDLVRLHLFGLKDEDCSDRTVTTKLPSYKAMVELAAADEAVKLKIGIEKQEAAQLEFADDYTELQPEIPEITHVEGKGNRKYNLLGLPVVSHETDESAGTEWLKKLDIDRQGERKYTFKNLKLILHNDPDLSGKIALNRFKNLPVVLDNLPWQPINRAHPIGRVFSDRDMADLQIFVENHYGIYGPAKTKQALISACAAHSFHPVENYLGGLQWDQVDRLDSVLVDYFGCEDTEYTAAIARKWFTAAVKRIYEPGCKFDYMIVLIGAEGTYKSTFFRELAAPWFTDNFNFHMIKTKEASEQIRGRWIVEVGELTGLKKVEIQAVKSYVSREEDMQRDAFREFLTEAPRQCVFAATSNETTPLRGTDGNRRFWIAQANTEGVLKNMKDLSKERNQLWAEAKYRYEQGEPVYLSDELEKEAKEIQETYTEMDDRFDIIREYLEKKLPTGWDELNMYEKRAFLDGADETLPKGTHARKRISIPEIWNECLKAQVKDMNSQNTKALHDIMRKMPGWEAHKSKERFGDYGVQRSYRFVSAS